MAQRVELSAEDREELAYKLICWMKKWGLWEYTTLFSRETCYSSGIISELARPGWRSWEDVWTAPLSEEFTEEFREDLDTVQFLVDCGGTSLETLLESKLYAAEFGSLPADAQTALLRRTDLLEACVDWYGEYLESGMGFDDTKFDSFDEYWALESVNRDDFKLELLMEHLCAPLYGGISDTTYNEKVAELILLELEEILKIYYLSYYCYYGTARLF